LAKNLVKLAILKCEKGLSSAENDFSRVVNHETDAFERFKRLRFFDEHLRERFSNKVLNALKRKSPSSSTLDQIFTRDNYTFARNEESIFFAASQRDRYRNRVCHLEE